MIAHTEPGSAKPNEDLYQLSPNLVIVLDGATTRTDTGCIHGVPWFVRRLGLAIQGFVEGDSSLRSSLRCAIEAVMHEHQDTCDLSSPGSPSAAVGIVRIHKGLIDWLVLGDVTLIVESGTNLQVITDSHDHVAAKEVAVADRYPIGDPRKVDALIAMKHVELAAKNVSGGYWVASTSPDAAEHALYGSRSVDEIERITLMTDGAARLTDLFHLADWHTALQTDELSPQEIIQRVRQAEEGDPFGNRWPRNKKSDDATVVQLLP